MSVKAIPDGYHSITPYLICRDAARAVEFYQQALGARIKGGVMKGPDGKVMHAELVIGDSIIMLADENPERGASSPQTIGGSPMSMLVYVPNVDEVFAKAMAAGARQVSPVEKQFYGDRSGGFLDPFGHAWHVSTHVEDVSPEELQRRMAAMRK